MGKSCEKFLWEILAGKSCWEIVAGKSCGKILQEIVARKSCGKLLQEILWEMLWDIPHTNSKLFLKVIFKIYNSSRSTLLSLVNLKNSPVMG